jgi:subtilisin family serine protease
VTLVTGDKVRLGGVHGVEVHAAPGREHVDFFTRTDEQGDWHVLPEDAIPLLNKGKLDPRLFDVSELARDRYDDASRTTLPLIVDYAGPAPRGARALPAMGAAAVSVARSGDFWATARKADHVWLDGPVHVSLDHTGAGSTVAVLDTGIDATHPDLTDAVVGAHNFTDSDSDDDRVGHGTHVASIITGSGAASGGRYQGVAPDAKLLNGKVLDDSGSGYDSWIIAGMEWAADSGADVVNMSLGSQGPSDGTDPISQALNRITADTGTLFVVAAGNSGSAVGSPGAADAALTVGAVDRNDQLAGFSSRGRLDGGLKPDITAPGVGIVAAKAKNGQIGTPAEDGYVSLSGTSMATPHVAGAAAILAAEHPQWTAEQLKGTLTGSAKPTDGLTVFEQGAGRVDVAKAAAATVSSSPGSVNFGVVQWPHDDDQPITNEITYTNTGTSPVTLDLAVSGAPPGMFTVTPAQLTVPAGGRGSATVTADTGVDTADGVYGATVTATGAGQTVRTPVAVNREPESFDLTLKFIGRTGAPSDFYVADIWNVNERGAYFPFDSSGTVRLRLPRGEYYLDGAILSENANGDHHFDLFGEPSIDLTRDVSLVLDAREGKQVGFQVDRPDAKVGTASVTLERETAWAGTVASGAYVHDDLGTIRSATTTSQKFTFTAEAQLARWNGTSFDGSPYIYHVRHTEKGTVPQTPRWCFRDNQLAKVRSAHASTTPGTVGRRDDLVTFPLPGTLTEYYTPDVPWSGSTFYEMSAPDAYPVLSAVYQSTPRTFHLGGTTTVHWGYGVFAPVFPAVGDGFSMYAERNGDVLWLNLPMAGDRERDHEGYEFTGTSTLLRDGQVVGAEPYAGSGSFEVGPEPASYTFRTSADRSASSVLSTRIDAEWTFTSAHTEDQIALPLLAVRFAPNLDGHNAAPAGKRFTIPVYVQRNGGDVGQVSTPVVEASYDDGTTWQPARVARAGGEWAATVDHPRGARFVSLRSSVSDPAGTTQRLTVIRAYALV